MFNVKAKLNQLFDIFLYPRLFSDSRLFSHDCCVWENLTDRLLTYSAGYLYTEHQQIVSSKTVKKSL